MAAVPSRGRAAVVESEALGRLYERHAQQVFRYCLGYLRTREEAEDAVQTTYLRALGALRRGVVPRSEPAWLLTIARNVCLNRCDYARRRRSLELVQDPQVLAETSPGRALDEVDVAELQAALRRLPERQREAILLREWRGLSYGEIGEELGLSTSAVEMLIFRARRALARELGGEEGRRGLDLPGLLGWLKALLGGGAAKIAIGAAVVASVGVVAPVVAESGGHGRGAPAGAFVVAHAPVARPAPAAAAPRAGAPARASRLRSHRTAPVTAPARAAVTPARPRVPAPSSTPPAEPAPASTTAQPGQAAPAPAEPAPPAPGSTASTVAEALPQLPVTTPSLPDPTEAVTTAVQTPPLPDPAQLPPLPSAPPLPPPPAPLPQAPPLP